MTCDDDALKLLLEADEGSGDFREVAAHVESCSQCQSRLAEIAADANDWQEARAWLRDEEVADVQAIEEFAAQSWLRRGSGRGVRACSESMAKQVLAPPSHPEMLGRIGRYEVERLVGSGGMGVVFKALDMELNRAVAVKVLAPHLAGTGAARNRFAREARAAAAVVDEHVVAIHNVEVDGDSPFLVMQYVAGESLQARIDRNGALELCEILRIAVQTARGLAAAHEQGLIHRDIKPSNIMLENSVERALLTDFGLARAADDATITRSGYHPGTPHYMSPEQARGESIDARSDLFSLGSVMYAMCTGRVPFRADTSYGIIRRIIDTKPRPIRDINPAIPGWLCSIIAKLMSKERGDRYGSPSEVASMLDTCLAHVQDPTTNESPEALFPETRAQQSSRRRSIRGVALMAVTFGIIALGAFAFVATEPPDISGNWWGEIWKQVVLMPVEGKPHQYEGTFATLTTEMLEKVPDQSQLSPSSEASEGTLQLKWSRIERRFNGTWKENERHFGRLSLQLEGDDVIRGARTTAKPPGDKSATPRLAEFKWDKSVPLGDPSTDQKPQGATAPEKSSGDVGRRLRPSDQAAQRRDKRFIVNSTTQLNGNQFVVFSAGANDDVRRGRLCWVVDRRMIVKAELEVVTTKANSSVARVKQQFVSHDVAARDTVIFSSPFKRDEPDKFHAYVPPVRSREVRAARTGQVRRSLDTLPEGLSKEAHYCLLMFGTEAEVPLWLVHDSGKLYVDLNANGDLSEPAEVFLEKKERNFFVDGIASQGWIIPSSSRYAPELRGYFPLRVSWQDEGRHSLWIRLKVPHRFWQQAIIPASATSAEYAPILHFDGPLQYFLLSPKTRFVASDNWPSLTVGVGTLSPTGDIVYVDLDDAPLTADDLPHLSALYFGRSQSERINRSELKPDQYGGYLVSTLKTTKEMRSGEIEIFVSAPPDSPLHAAPLKCRLPLFTIPAEQQDSDDNFPAEANTQ